MSHRTQIRTTSGHPTEPRHLGILPQAKTIEGNRTQRREQERKRKKWGEEEEEEEEASRMIEGTWKPP